MLLRTDNRGFLRCFLRNASPSVDYRDIRGYYRKTVLIIGLGRFGSDTAMKLHELVTGYGYRHFRRQDQRRPSVRYQRTDWRLCQ